MEEYQKRFAENRFCNVCQGPLETKEHGNRKAHMDCAYENKKQKQKEKYKIGNSVKLMIQKNEALAAHLYNRDQKKLGFPYLVVLELGLKFTCPSTPRVYLNKKINMFDKYGYSIETINGETLIFFYHEDDLH